MSGGTWFIEELVEILFTSIIVTRQQIYDGLIETTESERLNTVLLFAMQFTQGVRNFSLIRPSAQTQA